MDPPLPIPPKDLGRLKCLSRYDLLLPGLSPEDAEYLGSDFSDNLLAVMWLAGKLNKKKDLMVNDVKKGAFHWSGLGFNKSSESILYERQMGRFSLAWTRFMTGVSFIKPLVNPEQRNNIIDFMSKAHRVLSPLHDTIRYRWEDAPKNLPWVLTTDIRAIFKVEAELAYYRSMDLKRVGEHVLDDKVTTSDDMLKQFLIATLILANAYIYLQECPPIPYKPLRSYITDLEIYVKGHYHILRAIQMYRLYTDKSLVGDDSLVIDRYGVKWAEKNTVIMSQAILHMEQHLKSVHRPTKLSVKLSVACRLIKESVLYTTDTVKLNLHEELVFVGSRPTDKGNIYEGVVKSSKMWREPSDSETCSIDRVSKIVQSL